MVGVMADIHDDLVLAVVRVHKNYEGRHHNFLIQCLF